jgi:moderate conductance mechanosensitive channel
MNILKKAYSIMFSPEKVVSYSGKAMGIALSIIVIYAIYKVIVIAIDKTLKDRLNDDRMKMLVSLGKSVLRYAAFVIIFITILQQLGINITALLASAGMLGLAISFGSQNLVKDIISGIFIIIERRFMIGDIVMISGIKGEVIKMTLRMTAIKTEDGTTHTLPNGSIGVVQNFNR